MKSRHFFAFGILAASGILSLPAAVTGRICESSLRCWERGEEPAVAVMLSNPGPDAETAEVKLRLLTDTRLPAGEFTRRARLSAGDSARVEFTGLGLAPGFYRAGVTVGAEALPEFNLGYDPTAIVSPADAPSDFAEFWQQALGELAAVEPDYRLTPDPYRSSGDKRVYQVEMKSLPDSAGGEPVVIRGFYTEPVAPGKYPVLITYQGYDGGTSQMYYGNPDSNPGWIEFYLSSRGQLMNNRGENVNPYGDWFASGFGDKERYYYRSAFMDVVRAIDFVTSREKADTARVYAQGQSQGGAFTVASAALGSGRIKGIAPAVTFLGDFPDYFRIVDWPANVARGCRDRLGMTDGQMYAFLSYFDTKNLAPMVTCPVYASFGLQDPVCPPHTNFASFNLFASPDKRYVVQPTLGHTVAPDWYRVFIEFFDSLAPRQ